MIWSAEGQWHLDGLNLHAKRSRVALGPEQEPAGGQPAESASPCLAPSALHPGPFAAWGGSSSRECRPAACLRGRSTSLSRLRTPISLCPGQQLSSAECCSPLFLCAMAMICWANGNGTVRGGGCLKGPQWRHPCILQTSRIERRCSVHSPPKVGIPPPRLGSYSRVPKTTVPQMMLNRTILNSKFRTIPGVRNQPLIESGGGTAGQKEFYLFYFLFFPPRKWLLLKTKHPSGRGGRWLSSRS